MYCLSICLTTTVAIKWLLALHAFCRHLIFHSNYFLIPHALGNSFLSHFTRILRNKSKEWLIGFFFCYFIYYKQTVGNSLSFFIFPKCIYRIHSTATAIIKYSRTKLKLPLWKLEFFPFFWESSFSMKCITKTLNTYKSSKNFLCVPGTVHSVCKICTEINVKLFAWNDIKTKISFDLSGSSKSLPLIVYVRCMEKLLFFSGSLPLNTNMKMQNGSV